MTVELHWDDYPVDGTLFFNSANFWEAPDVIDLERFPVHGLNPSHLLLSSCLHLFYEHKLDRLIRVIDIRQIVNTAKDIIDWDWIVDQTIGGSQRLAVWQTLRFASEIADAQAPSIVLRQLAPVRYSEKMSASMFPPFALMATPSNSSRLRRFIFFTMLKHLN